MMKTQSLIPIFSVLFTIPWAACAEAQDTNGLLLNFHDVPLRAALNYLSDQAGLIVVSEADVQGSITVTANQPVSTAEAINLLNDQLSRNHYAAVLEGRTLTVMEAGAARTNPLTPVATLGDPATIPVNNRIVTEILPVHTLNPGQLVKDLEPLIPSGDTVTANEAGKAVIMTASQKDIHRIAAIISALDSTAVSEVNVFTLNYADAKSVAAELKELFQSADSDATRAGAPILFGPRFGRPGVGGGGDEKEKTAPTRPVFVADEQMNAVAASAPPNYMPMIARVVELIDRQGQEVTEVEVFPLLHAEPTEVVEEISSLFGAGTFTGPETAVRQPGFQFGGPGFSPATARATPESSRLKRQAAVTAVADRRTESVVVAASENMMTQIRKVIAKLDESDKGMMKLSVISADFADAGTVLDAMTALFGSSASTAHPQAQFNTPQDARAAATSAAMSASTSGPLGASASATGLH